MTDVSCLLAGLIWLGISPVLLMIRHKKKGTRLLPALIAFPVCLPVFLISGAIRSGFAQDDLISYCLQQGLLYGIAEEGAKYLALRFLLPSYDSMEDAVSYGIGHGAWEAFGSGLTCLGLIGTESAAADILPVNLWAAAEGTLSVIALTVLILHGIRTGKTKIMLPAAILFHAVGNAVGGIFRFSIPIVAVLRTLLTAAECYVAYRCLRGTGTDDSLQ